MINFAIQNSGEIIEFSVSSVGLIGYPYVYRVNIHYYPTSYTKAIDCRSTFKKKNNKTSKRHYLYDKIANTFLTMVLIC